MGEIMNECQECGCNKCICVNDYSMTVTKEQTVDVDGHKCRRMNENAIVDAYSDKIFKTNLKTLYVLLYRMRYETARTYHPDGSMTIKLDLKLAEELELIFDELEDM